jgi:flagellar basal-body rod modification protein FlgD
MTSPTSGMSGPTGANAATGKNNIAAKSLGDKDTFLKLLVAQLKYQDPSKPADSTQFLAQTAQFTQVEKLGDIADLLKSQRMLSASALVGHSVKFMDESGVHQEGVITSAKLNGDSEPVLRIGNMDVLLSKVMEVQSTAPPAGTAGTTAPAPGGTATAAKPSTSPATGPATA